METAYDYFQRITRHVAHGPGGWPAAAENPRLRKIVASIRSIEVVKHGVIVRK
jgi:hypothetical protein